jgi:hypothetical protein
LATKVYEVSEIELQDGTKITLRPLPINKLRKFMDVMLKMDGSQSEEQVVETLIEAASFGISQSAPELANDREKLGDVLDMPTIKHIIKICGGVDLDDPNLIAAALATGQSSI